MSREATQFKPGQSGNPSGRRRLPAEFKEMATAAGPECFERVLKLTKDKSSTVALKACELVLSYAYGRPTQPFAADEPLEIQINHFGYHEKLTEMLDGIRDRMEATEPSSAKTINEAPAKEPAYHTRDDDLATPEPSTDPRRANGHRAPHLDSLTLDRLDRDDDVTTATYDPFRRN